MACIKWEVGFLSKLLWDRMDRDVHLRIEYSDVFLGSVGRLGYFGFADDCTFPVWTTELTSE